MKKLVLFDIDGTLLRVKGISRESLMKAFIETFGVHGNAMTHNMAGKLDSQIIEECMLDFGISKEEIDKKFYEIKEAYIDIFVKQATPQHIYLMPAVEVLLEKLAQNSDVILGLLTGNFERSGRHKLKLGNIDNHFPFGSFAEDGKTRNELPPVAVARAKSIYGKEFKGQDVVIIGDTQYDIQCAKVLNSKCIAVATGNDTVEKLQTFNPSVCIKDLSDTEAVLAHIYAN